MRVMAACRFGAALTWLSHSRACMTLDDLRLFVATIEEGSLTRAVAAGCS